MKRKLVLSGGQSFAGDSFGADRDAVCGLVFNTSMVGYQEILSDPSYTDQAVVMTYPFIGNYGTAEEDCESERPTIGALIVRHYSEIPSNFRSTASLGSVMERFDIPGLCGVDARAVTRLIRDQGSQKALLTGAETPTAWTRPWRRPGRSAIPWCCGPPSPWAAPAFSFSKLHGLDACLSPEMKSTDEAIGCGASSPRAARSSWNPSGQAMSAT